MKTDTINLASTSIGEGMQIFNSEAFGTIRTAGTSDEPLFCLSDICRILELQPSRVKDRLKQDGVTSSKVGVQTGIKADGTPAMQNVDMIFINEQNLYRVIMRSDKPQAEAFQDWVCGEVLPAIRKQGGYMVAQAEETPEQIMARALKVADETLKRKDALLQAQAEQIAAQTQEIAEIAPLADYTKDVLQSTSTYTLTQVSKDLGFRSVHEFTAWAKEHHILYRQSDQWMPTSQYSTNGWFTTRTFKYVKHDDSIGTSMTTVITEKGRKGLRTTLNSK